MPRLKPTTRTNRFKDPARKGGARPGAGRPPGITTPVPPGAIVPDPRTPEQVQEDLQMGLIRRLFQRGIPLETIYQATRSEYGIGRHRTETLLTQVLEVMDREVALARPHAKSVQLLRLKANLSDLYGCLEVERRKDASDPGVVAKLTGSLAVTEALIARIEGNFAAERVVHQHNVSAQVAAVFSALTPEQMAEKVALAVERRRLAEVGRALETGFQAASDEHEVPGD